MKQAKELYNALRDVLNTGEDIFPAVVTALDKSLFTCDVVFDGLDLGGVRLQSIVKDGVKGVQVFPALGSVVLVKRINDTEYFVTMYSDVESVLMRVADKSYTLNNYGHLIAGTNGADTLLQVITLVIEAVTQIAVLYGNNPDYTKLSQALEKANNILQ